MATVRKKLADADLIRRLGQVVHAAFLYAGFVTYGVQPPSGHVLRKTTESGGTSLTFCRWYTAPQLAHREDAEAAVLVLCAAEESSDVALVVFLTKARDMEGTYLERLDAATLALSAGRRCSKISWSLADGVCRDLLDQLRRRNGLTLPGFRSLPDDAKVEILKRLHRGEDLAMVECTCRDLRRLVAARDGELWRHMYEADPAVKERWRTPKLMIRYEELRTCTWIGFPASRTTCKFGSGWMRSKSSWSGRSSCVKSSDDGVPSWKQKYMQEADVLLPNTRVKIIWRLRERPRPGDDVEGTDKASIIV